MDDPGNASRYDGLTCPTCGYNLKGLSQPVCPECGAGFDPEELRANEPDTRWVNTRVGEVITCCLVSISICWVALPGILEASRPKAFDDYLSHRVFILVCVLMPFVYAALFPMVRLFRIRGSFMRQWWIAMSAISIAFWVGVLPIALTVIL